MNKVKELVEKYIEWVAVALGLAFVAYMVFAYVLKSPTITVNGRDLGPGEIDQNTVDTSVSELERKMAENRVPAIRVPSFTGDFGREMSGPTTRPLLASWTRSQPLPSDLPISSSAAANFDPTAPVNASPSVTGQIKTLAALPMATVTGVSQGVSTVNPNVFIPASTLNTPTPAPGVQGVDKRWVSVGFEIPMEAIKTAFTSSKIPQGLMTSFLRFEIQREEMVSPGVWGNAVIVRPLTNSPLGNNPLPAAANAQAEQMYKAWADGNQVEVLQPSFYALLGGSPWNVPGSGVVGQSGGFNPLNYLTGPIPANLTPEQRAEVMKARAKAYADEVARKREEQRSSGPPGGGAGGGRPGGRPPGGGPPGGGRGGGFFIPTPPPEYSLMPGGEGENGVMSVMFQFRGGPPPGSQRPPGYPPNMPWPPPEESYPPEGFEPGGMNQPGPQAPSMGPIPQGQFDPTVWTQGDVKAFQHDETVEAGKVYRYRGRYVLMSPVYQQPAAAGTPEMASEFKWISPWTNWSTEVRIPSTVSFFVASNITTNATSVQFEVFRYLNGQMRSKTYTINPGDQIGGPDTVADFATGYVLVDIRRDPRGNYALVMGPDGTITRRDASDTKLDMYVDFKNQVSTSATP